MGKEIKLEKEVFNANGKKARIDVFCEKCDIKNLKIEYKHGPTSITKGNIQSEFIERDLYNASSFDEVQWRMRDTGLTKDGLKNLLEKQNVKESIQDKLGADKVNALLKRGDLVDSNPEQISQALIDYFDNEENYEKIFKNVY